MDATAIGTAYAAWDATAYSASTDLLVNSAMATSKANLVVVRAADMSGAGNTFAAYKPGSVALVRLAGDCVASPTAGSWTETKTEGDKTTGDGFTINVAYTFKPAAVTKYNVTVNVVDASTTGGTATADVTKAAEGDTVTVTVDIGSASSAALSVKDAENNAVTITPTTLSADGTATFTMPAGAVEVTVTFAA